MTILKTPVHDHNYQPMYHFDPRETLTLEEMTELIVQMQFCVNQIVFDRMSPGLRRHFTRGGTN